MYWEKTDEDLGVWKSVLAWGEIYKPEVKRLMEPAI